MGNENSIPNDNASGNYDMGNVSVSHTGAHGHRPINMQKVQNTILIWLDNNIDDTSVEYCNIRTQLQCVINTIKTYTNSDQCIEFIQSMSNEKACMIVSGSLGQHIVPRIHDMSQVDSIFIFCSNKAAHEQWAKEWPKIRGVFTETSPICEALKQVAKQCEQNATSTSVVVTSGDVSKKDLDQLDASFMYTQILKEILLTTQFKEEHFEEFIAYYRNVFADNEAELVNLDKLQQKYYDKTPIRWSTYKCFLFPLVNHALQQMEVNTIIKMGFFIGDLHRHIEKLHNEQFGDHNSGNRFTVYRGQGMSKTEFEQIEKNRGGLTSFNNFLITNKNYNISLDVARHAATKSGLVGILFVMTIDPSIRTTPFASIKDVSYHKDKDDVLFSMHTVFRICEIKPIPEHSRLFQVKLTLTCDTDRELRMLTDRIREETFSNKEGWFRLGSLLLKLGQFEDAQKLYEKLLKQATDESEKASIYDQLGCAKCNREEYEEAIPFYKKSLAIYQKTLPPNHPDLVCSYDNIGNVYKEMGEYSKAVSSYEKALEIKRQSLPPNHPDLARSYANIGNVYYKMGEYLKALSVHEKAFEIGQRTLPPNHPILARSYANIGNVYYKMKEYSKALSLHEKALEITQVSLPPNHPELARSYDNISNVYNEMGEYSKAVSSYEKALEIKQQLLPLNHPDLALSYSNIGNVYCKIGEYSKALSAHEKAFKIYQEILPANHPELQKCRENLDSVKKKL